MKQRIITGLIFTLVIAAFIVPGYWSIWPPLTLFAAIAVIASCELVSAMRQCGRRVQAVQVIPGSLVSLLLPLLLYLVLPRETGLAAAALVFSISLLVLFFTLAVGSIGRLLTSGPAAFPDALASGGVMLYVAFPLTCATVMFLYAGNGWLWLVIGMSAPWISDVFAYFTGSLCGRHPAVPALSPKKTLEGCLGGLVGGMLFQLLVFQLFRVLLGPAGIWQPAAILFALLSGLLLSIASQLGDWLASGYKRFCGIKDFGAVLPGHGGLMDRFDSVFFTLPVALVLSVLHQLVFA
ncbi:MAG: phosphatidate cytidylyltransferase [Clostridiaceae bacterium]|jgi:phosphatidate cytidylyltransferase|nr:phosphatidate cytidylyltransferase [Clostridiaceae bacterium]